MTTNHFPETLDPEQAGSRFTSRPAVAVLAGRGGISRFREGDDVGDADSVIAAAVGDEESRETTALGVGSAVNGDYGRGASAWVPVIEWVGMAVIGGLIGNAAWESVKAAAQELRDLVGGLRGAQARIVVSRGSAGLLAIADVLERTDEQGILDVESVTEPSVIAGRPITETSYVDYEPWLVSLVDETRTVRYVIAVSPSGEVLDRMRCPIGEYEAMYSVLPPRH